MGDSGSMLIGLVLSASAVTLTGQFSPDQISEGAAGSQASFLPTLLPLLLPLSILIIPMLDLVLAVVRRTRAGRSPFAPDKQHLHHRLLEIGHSHRRAVLIMWMWAALVAFGTVLISLYSDEAWMWVAVGRWRSLTIATTFLLPEAAAAPPAVPPTGPRRGLRDPRLRGPVSAARNACASFHKHPAARQPRENGRRR